MGVGHFLDHSSSGAVSVRQSFLQLAFGNSFQCHSDFVLISPHSKKPKRPQRQRQQNNRLKPLTLAYDGDTDM